MNRMNKSKDDKIHVIDQNNQPYGSVRRCCNMCGVINLDIVHYVELVSEWWELPEDKRCR